MTLNVALKISDSGKLVTIYAMNGRIIAEVLVQGPFYDCAENANNNVPIIKGLANIYRGELIPIDRDEYLDVRAERIVSKIPRNTEEKKAI
jgi:hypothetical protein